MNWHAGRDGDSSLTTTAGRVPFHESFESGVLSNCCDLFAGVGRIQITTNHGPRTGARHLTMDACEHVQFNELVLTVDLAGKRSHPRILATGFGDERQLMGSSFSGRQNGMAWP